MYTIFTAIMVPIMFLIAGLVATVIYFCVKNKSRNKQMLVFSIIAFAFALLETSKQIYATFTEYDIFYIPLHICSFIMFFIITATCLKPDTKASKIFWSVSVITSFMITIGLIFGPEGIFGNQCEDILLGEADYLSWHSYIHHTLIVIFFFLALYLKPWSPDPNESIIACLIFQSVLSISWIFTNLFDKNYSAFLSFGSTFEIQLAVWLVMMSSFLASSLIFCLVAKKRKNK